MRRRHLQQLLHRAVGDDASRRAVGDDLTDTPDRPKHVDGWRSGEREVDPTPGLGLQRADALHHDEVPPTKDPNDIGKLLHLVQDVRREEDRPAGITRFAHHRHEFHLHQRVQSDRWLIEDEQLRPVHERLDEPELLAVSVRHRPDVSREVQVQPLGEQLGVGPLHTVPQ